MWIIRKDKTRRYIIRYNELFMIVEIVSEKLKYGVNGIELTSSRLYDCVLVWLYDCSIRWLYTFIYDRFLNWYWEI